MPVRFESIRDGWCYFLATRSPPISASFFVVGPATVLYISLYAGSEFFEICFVWQWVFYLISNQNHNTNCKQTYEISGKREACNFIYASTHEKESSIVVTIHFIHNYRFLFAAAGCIVAYVWPCGWCCLCACCLFTEYIICIISSTLFISSSAMMCLCTIQFVPLSRSFDRIASKKSCL